MSEIFNLVPLERQSNINGQICDILAVTQNKQLVIIELKNTEDRYVINQLTRYYDALIQEKPFKNKVDYQQEILLYAICPIFHQHNLIDVKHSKLHFELFQSSVIKEESGFYQLLKNINKNKLYGKYRIHYREIDWRQEFNGNVPNPDKLLADWLDLLSEKEKLNILKIRDSILTFDDRLNEISEDKSIFYGVQYGQNKIRSCAEFRFDRYSKKVLFFLWLIDRGLKNEPVTRMQIDTINDYKDFCRLIVLKEKAISFKKLNDFGIGHKFYSYNYQEGEVRVTITTPQVAPGYNWMFRDKNKNEWGTLSLFSVQPIELIIEDALTTWRKRMPRR